MEGRPFARRRTYIHFPCMLLDDSVRHGKAKSGSSTGSLGREERIKNPVNMFPWDSGSGVHNLDLPRFHCGPWS